MEANAYGLLYFIKGSLPWQGLQASSKHDKYRKIMEKKISTPVEELCRRAAERVLELPKLREESEVRSPARLRLPAKDAEGAVYHRELRLDYMFDWNLHPNRRQKSEAPSEERKTCEPPVEREVVEEMPKEEIKKKRCQVF
eukprot:CAMPEP_0204904032 /NCGR_PEP_ID=MMETSP1397-20131031/4630_1 /ASSEMBLY_ACC=CAM_ASM_000891 /TAXON_ID=49980 /ORGANISM="Climacostomum Climacostomum virens, Strain Stock W-24" /LENGTH=140 /DNA_ID=CAMNT_0052072763 /DNA_START=297 /DNA_END=718 /DNA_ORIENTATION=+